MAEVLGFEHFSLDAKGPTLTTSIHSGVIVAVMGPSGSGKSSLLDILSGAEKPGQGSIRRRASVRIAEVGGGKRTKVQALARAAAGEDASNLLITLHLAELRQSAIGDLTPSQFAACELMSALGGGPGIVLIDGQLDLLDPWTIEDVLRWMRHRNDVAFMVVTNRPEIAERMDSLLLLRSRQVRFAGTGADLVRSVAHQELLVTTERQAAVRALIEPFEVTVSDVEGGLLLRAKEGQEIAAKLLAEGYGDVRFVVCRTPTLADALRNL
jgi:ABC-type lipoprotein export system ATPase subunit